MRVGDVVKKTRGWGANCDEGPFIGLVVDINIRRPRSQFDNPKYKMVKYAVVATDGFVEEWIADFCEVLYESR